MKLTVVSFVVLLILSANIVVAKEPEWLKKMKQVSLLSDTYEDVIKIFGNPVDGTVERELSEYFDFPDGRLWVGFETGKCVLIDGKPNGWEVPEYVVSEVSFSPDKWIDPKKLGVKNFIGFIAKPIHEGREGIEYVNDELGIDYIVNQGKIQNVIFRPAKNQDHLLCK